MYKTSALPLCTLLLLSCSNRHFSYVWNSNENFIYYFRLGAPEGSNRCNCSTFQKLYLIICNFLSCKCYNFRKSFWYKNLLTPDLLKDICNDMVIYVVGTGTMSQFWTRVDSGFQYLFGSWKILYTESIEWLIEDQAFLPSYDLAPPPSDTQEDWERDCIAPA